MEAPNITVDVQTNDNIFQTFNGILSGILIGIGFLGNTVAFYIYTCLIYENVKYFIPFLAMCDCLQTFLAGLYYFVVGQYWNCPNTTLCRLWMYLNGVNFYLSIFFLLLAAIQLFILVVCDPGNNLISLRKRILAVAVIVFALLYTIPTFTVADIHNVEVFRPDNQTMIMKLCLPISKSGLTHEIKVYYLCGDVLTLLLICVHIVLYIYIGIFICKKYYKSKMVSKSEERQRQSKLIWMYLIITIVTFIFYIPPGVIRIVFLMKDSQNYSSFEWNSMVLGYQLYLVGSVLNPFVYISFDKNARDKIVERLPFCNLKN